MTNMLRAQNRGRSDPGAEIPSRDPVLALAKPHVRPIVMGSLAIFAGLFQTGCYLLALWLASSLVAWLFLLGAAAASDRQ